MTRTQLNDIKEFEKAFKMSSQMQNSKFLVTGGTGLIGSALVRCLLSLTVVQCITLVVRDKKKAELMYKGEEKKIRIVQCDIVDYVQSLDEYYDYIIHCASPTNGKYIEANPVECFELAYSSTHALLSYAHKKRIKGMIYVSSLEYYGQNFDDDIICENYLGYIDCQSPRSSYPLGKRAAEYMCLMYAKEYNVPVKIARLTQTFGAGVSLSDNRVFAQFAKSIINNTDIILHTTGESAKPYCYLTDCVSAIFCILLKGENGEAYNVANQDTYINIRGLAEFLCQEFNPNISVQVENHPEMGYAPITKLHLSSEKLMSLGWHPNYDLREMFSRLINSFKEQYAGQKS